MLFELIWKFLLACAKIFIQFRKFKEDAAWKSCSFYSPRIGVDFLCRGSFKESRALPHPHERHSVQLFRRICLQELLVLRQILQPLHLNWKPGLLFEKTRNQPKGFFIVFYSNFYWIWMFTGFRQIFLQVRHSLPWSAEVTGNWTLSFGKPAGLQQTCNQQTCSCYCRDRHGFCSRTNSCMPLYGEFHFFLMNLTFKVSAGSNCSQQDNQRWLNPAGIPHRWLQVHFHRLHQWQESWCYKPHCDN